MIKQFFDSILVRLMLLIGIMIVAMWLFNVPLTTPDRAIHHCLGVDIPSEINAAHSERFCRCVKNAQGDQEQKTQICLKTENFMQQNAQKSRQFAQ